MPLTPGTRLGPYEVVSPIGAGGMGEVYEARDTRLGRHVAIKVVADLFLQDVERLARFEREAKTLASLNHPNIAAIHGVEESNGVQALVLELVEGPTLAERIARGPLPVDEALRIARQITDALEAAHDHGIIHRDLKPANIKLRTDGTVKVLDFGLAKALEGEVAEGDVSHSPTLSMAATLAGVILGTAAYMAPEQAKGAAVDRRADLFAFGAVLYEMLTGRRAFPGDSTTEIVAAVLKSEPDWSRLPADTPEPIRRLLRRCLEKDRRRRLQTAGDARIEIEDALAAEALPIVAGVSPRNLIWRIGAVAIALLVAAAAGVTLFYAGGPSTTETPPIRFAILPPEKAIFTSAGVPAVSPDGRRVVFAAVIDGTSLLWVRALDELDAKALPGTEGAMYPFWSPDNRTIGFISSGKVMVVDASGGPTRAVADVPVGVQGATWGHDDVIVIGRTTAGLVTVSANGGTPVPLTHGTREQPSHRFPSFLPDGRRLLYFASGAIWLTSLDGGEPTRLLAADSQAAYMAPGFLLFTRQGTLMAQPFNADRGTVTGQPVPVAQQVLADLSGPSPFSGSFAGVLAYRTGSSIEMTQLTWVDRSGKVLSTVGAPGTYRNPDLSPDGTRIAIEVTDPQSRTSDIWIVDAARGVASRFTFDPHNDLYPIWSPDGEWIVFGSDRASVAVPNLYRKRTDGTGNEELIVKSAEDMVPLSWSPDGRLVVYRTIAGSGVGVPNLGILPVAGDGQPRLFQTSSFNESFGQVSPDGRWIAYRSQESRRNEVYVQSFPTAGGGKWQISQNGGSYPRWHPGGRELFYLGVDNHLMAAQITAANGLTVGAATRLFELRTPGGPVTPIGQSGAGFLAQYDVAPDGRRFLVNARLEVAPSQSLTIVVNWTAGLR